MTKKTGLLLLTILAFTVLFAACSSGGADGDTAGDAPVSLESVEPILPTATPVYSTPPPTPTPVTFPMDGYISKEGVNLRAEPVDGAILDVLGENVEVRLTSLQDEWYRVEYGDTVGYIREDMVAPGAAPRKDNMHWVRVTADEALLYKSNSDSDVSERTLKKGDVAKALRTLGDYKHIVLMDDYLQRYIHTSDVEVIPEEEALQLLPTPSPTATPAE